MNILLPVIIVSALGIAAGLLLSIVSVFMQVQKNEKQEILREQLPGANCGACGYAGCDSYALAVAEGRSDVTFCLPGGQSVKDALAEIMGIQAGSVRKMAAVVQCSGSRQNTAPKMRYIGEHTCAAANQMFGGPGSCTYGCLGFGDCAAVCAYGAIEIKDGVAVINKDQCAACSMCVRACPKSIIAMAPAQGAALVSCSSKDKGGDVRRICSAGCTGCTKCKRACDYDAIEITSFLARIDSEKCTACGACVTACPQNCIRIPG